nr:MAG: hypothetical protein 1 [Leviviridae sp.]
MISPIIRRDIFFSSIRIRPMTTKIRLKDGKHLTWHKVAGNGGSITSTDDGFFDTGFVVEKLTDDKHPYLRGHYRDRTKRQALLTKLYGIRDFGGPFSVQRRSSIVVPGYVPYATSSLNHAFTWWEFSGNVIPFDTPVGIPNISSVPVLISNSLLTGKGVVGWNRYKPTHTQINVGQTLGELRAIGGLPINPKMIHEIREIGRVLRHPLQTLRHATRTGIPGHDALRYGGSGYLAYQFGIRPYVEDIMALTRSVLDFDKKLRQLVRDNGRPVRRKGRVSLDETASNTRTTTSFPGTMLKPSFVSQLLTGSYVQDKTVSNSLEFWFSGRFRYHLDPTRHGYGPIPAREKFQLQRILYGIDPTDVSLIWELMPWSWLIDWIVPIGPMIDNLVNDQVDHLVADYAYIMGKSITTTKTVVTGQLRNSAPFTTSSIVIDETKQRVKASPYGFGLSFSGFSLKQLAILAALGVSR